MEARKLSIGAFALTCSLFWGFGLFAITWWIIMFDGPSNEPTFLGGIYRGYDVTARGSIIGLAWALVDGLVGGAIFAWLYNFMAARGSRAPSLP